MSEATASLASRAPVKATWIVMLVAWICFLVPVPGLGMFVGWPLNLVAFITAIVVITRGRTGAGITQIVCTLIVSPAIYFIGLAIFSAMVASPHHSGTQVGMVLPMLQHAID
ncbi:hypothetical protein [Kushneria phosphatilytica]|uniref:Uncharacterized protein n=1 Tax=Kushneria phosphatilytica TaxID=657387 RepID=A0A1S1NXP6_9GAMM|nr:hypothetical protein [Kushneria phosphatilytica]OHV11183.1 hypothetical protein BH688_07610 [Kushneria phosphatilytica]QEL12248.1 hypothetical protein FY550_14625 [Kushneria phosphatilytica]